MARQRIDEKTRKKIIDSHAKGIPMRKIAKQFKVSLSSVSRVVKEEKLKKGEVSGAREKFDKKKRVEILEKRISELEKKINEL